MRHGSPRRLGGERERGRRGRESVPRLGDDGLRRGTRESWDHGRGTSTQRLKRLQGEGSGRPRARKSSRTARARVGTTQRTRRRVTAFALERTLESKPQERQRTQRVRETGRRASRRGSEKLRGRTVAGEVTPRPTDLSGRCRWRGVKPQEGRPGPCRTGEDVAARTLRGRRSLWKPSCGLRAVRLDDRRNTSRPWKTAWRERRTNDAATTIGALREAREPCEGRPQHGDVRAEQSRRNPEPLKGTAADPSVQIGRASCRERV